MMRVDLAERFGTPLYVYDLDRLERSVEELRASLPTHLLLLYSVKANPNPVILHFIASLGCGAEVSSLGELGAAIEAGFPPESTLITGPGKSDPMLALAINHGCVVAIDSVREAERVVKLSDLIGSSPRCLLRINLPQRVGPAGLGISGGASKFGIDLEEILRRPQRIKATGVPIDGFEVFTSTNLPPDMLLTELTAHVKACAQASEALEIEPTFVDLGGGFPAPFGQPGSAPSIDLDEGLSPHLDRHFAGWRAGSPTVAVESGRRIVGPCGELVAEVVDVKYSHGTTFAVVDSGVHHLGGMSALRRVPPISVVPEVSLAQTGSHRSTVVGVLCTPLDTWARSVDAPNFAPGDVISVPNVGAYGLTASLVDFLSHDRPPEVVVRGAEVISATRTRNVVDNLLPRP